MSRLAEFWRWLLSNVIDLWKGAAVGTAVVETLLVVAALDKGLGHPVSWLFLLIVVAMLPLGFYCYRGFAASCRGENEPSLPPLEPTPVAEPPSHVRRVE